MSETEARTSDPAIETADACARRLQHQSVIDRGGCYKDFTGKEWVKGDILPAFAYDINMDLYRPAPGLLKASAPLISAVEPYVSIADSHKLISVEGACLYISLNWSTLTLGGITGALVYLNQEQITDLHNRINSFLSQVQNLPLFDYRASLQLPLWPDEMRERFCFTDEDRIVAADIVHWVGSDFNWRSDKIALKLQHAELREIRRACLVLRAMGSNL